MRAATCKGLEGEASGAMWHPMTGEIPGPNVTSTMTEGSDIIQFSARTK